MKKIMVVIFIMCSLLVYAEFPSTFAGATFGIPVGDVVSQLKATGMDVEQNGEEYAYFREIGGRLYFIILSDSSKGTINDIYAMTSGRNNQYITYKIIKKDVSYVYGSPTKESELFMYPYYDGDGYEDQAIILGKAAIFCEWKVDAGCIKLWCLRNGNVLLQYIADINLFEYEQHEEEVKSKNEY